MARHQCMEIVVNKFFGPKVNAAYTISGTVSGEAAALTGALNGAFIPAITTAYGTGDMEQMRGLAYRASKFGTLLTLPFAIPLGIEIDEALCLWLKNPPDHTAGLCIGMLVVVVIEKLTLGHLAAINASGKVAKFQVVRSIVCVSALPMAIGLLLAYRSVYMVAVVMVVTAAIMVVTDSLLSRCVGLSVRFLVGHVVLPLASVSIVSLMIGALPRLWLEPSVTRLAITTILVELTLLPLSWFVVLGNEERTFVRERVLRKIRWR